MPPLTRVLLLANAHCPSFMGFKVLKVDLHRSPPSVKCRSDYQQSNFQYSLPTQPGKHTTEILLGPGTLGPLGWSWLVFFGSKNKPKVVYPKPTVESHVFLNNWPFRCIYCNKNFHTEIGMVCHRYTHTYNTIYIYIYIIYIHIHIIYYILYIIYILYNNIYIYILYYIYMYYIVYILYYIYIYYIIYYICVCVRVC